MTAPARPTRLPSVDAMVGRSHRPEATPASLEQFARIKAERDLYKRLLDLGHVVDPQPFLKDALALIVEVAGARQAYLELYDDHSERVRSISHGFSDTEVDNLRTTISQGIIAKAVASGEMLVTPSAMLDPRFNEFDSVRIGKIEAVLCAPIGIDPVRGVLYLQGREHPGLYTEDERYSARMFAMQLAPLVNLLIKANDSRRTDPLEDLRQRLDFEGVIGTSPALVRILEKLPTVAPLDVGILLTGETGSGKSQIARVIHRNSTRHRGPFVDLNCGAIPENLIESELFGTVPGAFTGATDRAGKVEAAHGGTLFLDEIAEIPLQCQAKLLQLLQSHEYSRLGSTELRTADFRLIAATNVDLEHAVREKTFRADLYFRLNILPMRMPSLRERREDIRELLAYFCNIASMRHHLPEMRVSHGATVAAEAADWPGNLRELANGAEAAVIRAAAEAARQIERRHLFPARDDSESAATELTFQEATRFFQASFLRDALNDNDWNIAETSRKLDLARSHVYNLIKAFDLQRDG